jgi:polysaccharide pyruvyl transferase WcaK-like protein
MSADNFARVVVMNDTSGRSHHGCSRVMRLLGEGLARHGLRITARSAAHADWAQDRAFLQALREADLVVINGEGTLHHGRPAGARLLSVVDHPDRRGTPVALVNALWQENPGAWAGQLARCALVSLRDARSLEEVQRAGLTARLVPDLSLSAGAEPQPGPRQGLIVGDAVRHSARRQLALAARRLGAKALVPTKTRRSALWRRWPTGPLLSGLYYGAAPFGLPPLRLAADEAAYLAALGTSAGHLTGRFHAVCLSLVTGTPVFAVGSNSWKIEALMAEAGLDPDRMVAPGDLMHLGAGALMRPYSAQENTGIARFLDDARRKSEQLFTDLARLAREGRR